MTLFDKKETPRHKLDSKYLIHISSDCLYKYNISVFEGHSMDIFATHGKYWYISNDLFMTLL